MRLNLIWKQYQKQLVSKDELFRDIFEFIKRFSRIKDEDFHQEVIIKVLMELDSFRGNSSFVTWVGRIVRNSETDSFRKRQLDTVSLEEGFEVAEIEEDFEPEFSCDEDEQLYQLLIEEGLTQEEAAARLDVSIQAIKVRWHRFKERQRNVTK